MDRPIKPVELLVGHAPFLEQWTIDLTSVTVDRYVLLTVAKSGLAITRGH